MYLCVRGWSGYVVVIVVVRLRQGFLLLHLSIINTIRVNPRQEATTRSVWLEEILTLCSTTEYIPAKNKSTFQGRAGQDI